MFTMLIPSLIHSFFFFNDTATTEIYTLSLHDALPISTCGASSASGRRTKRRLCISGWGTFRDLVSTTSLKRSEEHTSELQSQSNLVCRLLLEKKKKEIIRHITRNKKIRYIKTTLCYIY